MKMGYFIALTLLLILLPIIYSAEEGLVGSWPLDEIKNGAVDDLSGNNYNGVLYSGDTPGIGNAALVEGKVGKALQFSGQEGVILDLPKINTAAGTKVTVEFWMYWNGESNMMPFGFESAYDLYFNPTNPTQFGFNTGYGDLWGIKDASGLANKWTYVVAEFNNGDVKLNKFYIDGVEQQVIQQWPLDPIIRSGQVSRYASISGWRASASYRFKGKLDEVKIYNKVFTANEIKAKYDAVVNPSPSQEPISYWKFDEGTGTTAGDYFGNNPGTLINNPTWTDGIKGKTLQFDGIDDYVDFGNPNNLKITKALTLEAWIKPTSLSSKIYAIAKSSGSLAQPYYQYSLQFDNNCNDKFELVLGIGGTLRSICGTTAGSIGTWYHVVAVSNGSVRSIYVNGVLENNQTISGDLNSYNTPVIFGKLDTSGSNLFQGSIDEVRIYNRALSADEILQHYQNELPPVPTCQTSCYWKFNDQVTGGTSKVVVEDKTIVQAKADCLKGSDGYLLSNETQVKFIVYEYDPLVDDKSGEQDSNTLGGNSFLDIVTAFVPDGDDQDEYHFKVQDSNGKEICTSGNGNNNLLYVNKPLPQPECAENIDCKEGYVCEGGSCILASKPECVENTDCKKGKQCVGGVCTIITTTCTTDDNCGIGYICDKGTCTLQQPECTKITDCPPDHNCENEKCIPITPEEPQTPVTQPTSEVAQFVPVTGTKELIFPVPKKYKVSSSALNADLFNKLENIDIFPAYEIQGQTKYCDTPYTYTIKQ